MIDPTTPTVATHLALYEVNQDLATLRANLGAARVTNEAGWPSWFCGSRHEHCILDSCGHHAADRRAGVADHDMPLRTCRDLDRCCRSHGENERDLPRPVI